MNEQSPGAGPTPRLYHSSALLLPDARVVLAGGGRRNELVDQPNAEFFSPPYLFQGPRPDTPQPESTTWSWAETVVVGSAATSASSIARATLLRIGHNTHQFSMDQSFMELEIVARDAANNTLTLRTPESAYIAPPGYYMLFLLSDAGVPSEAVYIQISC